MDDLLAARLQMAVSLGWHIVFACIGMTMPVLMAFSEWKWLQTNKQVYIDVAKAWSKGVAIFFAVGAVSGTVLSFELGLLFPGFMRHAGPIIGMPFSWEGTAFFVEAIALGVFLYGWNRLNKWVHWLSGVVVGISGVMSGVFVVSANAWMNSPAGFTWENGKAVNIDPVAAMFNDAWLSQALHMTLAAFVATSFAVAGVHAYLLIKNRKNAFHRTAVKIALSFGAVTAFLQPISGDFSAKDIAERQPAKLATLEALYKTSKPADLVIGGIPNDEEERVDYAIHVPGFLSFLAHGDFDVEVIGLDQFPKAERPPVLITHIAFQLMVGIGFLLAFAGLLFIVLSVWRKHLLSEKWWLLFIACLTPLGFIAVEAGWTVTEVGRQPWIIYGVMKTKDAVSSMPGLQYSFYVISTVYLLLTLILIWLMRRQIETVETHYPSARNTNE
ncbi:cytochrome ubiquinol oxidase subunit I [Pontibacter silvestris]|uniref:Cytochrome ubiquinol oxidase subunit I n=1 Tax=Pontibacter silvestris TaxID=2305183 RepID=A0ABW4WSD5_9BACT|nr:cytochrome ubiquinol oxidase subunit I [Pontibacter silvestris]MCC9137798.1 cytochrome ubiquinol oxidase subunit I [Pontibacter silvestris]